ncbi:MAG: hypothetical protein VKK04_09635 [Synechococcales bacterium]|nr:hypothetical protein [Synechococcales bacterium]
MQRLACRILAKPPMTPGLRLLVENLAFLAIATGLLVIAGSAWGNVKPFQLPQPLPGWFKYWFGTVQFLGLVPPLVALVWGMVQGDRTVTLIFTAYFVLLALQVLAEVLTLRRFQSVVWVMVPYLYVPYRLWQLYEGLTLLPPDEAGWIRWIFVGELVVWGTSHLIDITQLPRLFQWPGTVQASLTPSADEQTPP